MSLTQENTPLKDLINLAGKTALVTGGARGIGFAISKRLAEAGATVLIVDTNTAGGKEASERLKSYGYSAYFLECDVTREESVKNLISEATRKLGSIDILVNNAGIYPRKPLTEMTSGDFERVISVNLTGAFLCSRYASSEMLEKGQGGCIINIASIEALHPSSTGMSGYDASKGGLLMLTKSMARELGPHGIRVNAIAPGAIKTRGVLSNVGRTEVKSQLKELKSFMSRIALGRMGDADDIARVALFLVSDLAEYITGDLIVVDGGYLVS